jgi:hypothetical protein
MSIKNKKTQARFGRVVRSLWGIGEIREQKKPPNKRVLYLDLPVGAKHPPIWEDRKAKAIPHVTTQEIETAIKLVGVKLSEHQIEFSDAEAALDLLYAEFALRVDK